jgi:Na+-transporting methylmalonyl-CoA/oxaloacetate decarboxylase gamma subunit
MEHVAWGLYMTAAGMGTVFLLLLALMAVLMLVGRLDAVSPPATTADTTGTAGTAGTAGTTGTTDADAVEDADAADVGGVGVGGLSPDLLAAVSVAVLTHARVRRGQAAPAMRRVAPGSQLFASRWVSVGRAYQNRPWK